ncbi:phage shock protein PspC (stress-responsive transcriptional regulator) [Geodermatophilus bullaregiensis]|uniref:PspC domain-containing protein n=1 Tax=Geodermatophilus bullaregiensis TaxID=1564160 RepID=UPI00195DCAE8|nr:PspC domain-containing protein [Geodermatophilus bullaregiensis]MBM7808903.1 phage shock protein PspC (stress-responsive transcriptional regulator) [Geodermatophilus bullaregiensis]
MTSTPFPTPETVSPQAVPPQAVPPRTGRPQLRRSRSDAVLGGVSGGLAAHTGTDPVLWRVAFVGLTVAGGVGALLYLLLWVLVPQEPLGPGETARPVDRFVDDLHVRLAGPTARRD